MYSTKQTAKIVKTALKISFYYIIWFTFVNQKNYSKILFEFAAFNNKDNQVSFDKQSKIIYHKQFKYNKNGKAKQCLLTGVPIASLPKANVPQKLRSIFME